MLLLLFILATLLVILPLYIIYKPPNALIRYFQQRWPDVLWQLPTSRNIIALTIDDAPSEHTQELLRILTANNVTASFFIIGAQVPGRQDLMVDMVEQGHELSNHAMHDEASKSLSDDELRSQIETVQNLIANVYKSAGVPQPERRFFRPGSGFFSTSMRGLVQQMSHQIVLGGIYPHDPQIPYWWINARHILSMARPGGIIICHDRRPWTAPMLAKVLPELRRRGYQVMSLSQALQAT
ncbi:Peptidoglycan-N-acetylmuramic acid deacetylase PdaA [Cyphellophora attinorum]|uniref:chitin deacetylase n=1 Tax=Cyphellophora attinorum TaxID=1664694 RepID=A0A0N0NJX2_9EURO|nr:Peptidoglycan-N-acetylmuramic acid deacetylase PdaA [Phialophora attinorum]KPI37481.1 Peptidoglycan-N-acetylmuramic acid deacetylase PdaA [Phialophora attinorum]